MDALFHACSSAAKWGGYPDEYLPLHRWFDESKHHLADVRNKVELGADVTDLISEYVWETLVQYDCVNNDGGGGELTIDLGGDEPEFLFTCYTNEMVSTHHEQDMPV